MRTGMKGFWVDMLKPINPNLSVLIGLLNIIYGAWSFIPSDDQALLEYLSFVDVRIWGLLLIGLGIYMVFTNRTKSLCKQSKPMAVNAVVWTMVSAWIAYTDFSNSIWILTAFIAIYSIFVSANFWVNYEYPNKKT